MTQAKLTLDMEPTFWARVKLPVPGGAQPGEKVVEFDVEFKARTREELSKLSLDTTEVDDVGAVQSYVAGWNIEGIPFTPENIKKLSQKYHAFVRTVTKTYIDQQMQARLGN